MKFNRSILIRSILLISLIASLTVLSSRLQADTGSCGGVTITLPFNDVMASPFFCQIAAAYFSGLTNGTTATTFSPADDVTREQMAAFTTRTLDQSLKRGSRRAALNQWWTPQGPNNLGVTIVGVYPHSVISDGADLWVENTESFTVSRVRASDGKLLETWTNAEGCNDVLVAMGKVFIVGGGNPGRLYQIDPTQPPGPVTTLSSSLGISPGAIAFDGQRIWTANFGNVNAGTGSISIVTLNPPTVTTITTGFSQPVGILYDGTNIWVTDEGDEKLKRLDANGNVIQSIEAGVNPQNLTFDGTNLWVPIPFTDTVAVVRASTGTILATLSGNGLNSPRVAAFDGERILVTNFNGDSVSLWRASDLTPLGTFFMGQGTIPNGACSDGLNFWITLANTDKLARF